MSLKQFTDWHKLVEYLLENPKAKALDYQGREYGYTTALRVLGYDNANKRGLLADYKRLVLNAA